MSTDIPAIAITTKRDGARIPPIPGRTRCSQSYGPWCVTTIPQTRTSGPNDSTKPAKAITP